jgi:Flp pilus assembly protein TadD
MTQRGRLDEGVAECREAIRLRPDDASAHRNLGVARQQQGAFDDAIVELRQAVRLAPRDHQSHFALATALDSVGRRDEALRELQETVRLKPDEATAHYNLGIALFCSYRLDDALAEYRESIRLNPSSAEAHYNLADIHRINGTVDQAIAEYRTAIRLKPDFAEAHCNLAHVFKAQGQYAAALAEFERGHELGSQRADWAYPSAKWIEQARRVLRAERDLAALLRGDRKPATVTERLDFAHVAYTRALHATATRLWSEALALEPKLASDPTNRLRFAAARCAAMAGCGRGKDEPPPDDATKAAFRSQAHDWLQADLEAASDIVATRGAHAKHAVHEMLLYWKGDRDLAGIRDPSALGSLPQAEQERWRELWQHVDGLLK